MPIDRPYIPTCVVTTPPSTEPVTVAEAKRAANVVASDDDTYIGTLISTARELVERDTSRALITQTLRARWASFPSIDWRDEISLHRSAVALDRIELPRPPLASVSHVHYVDPDGVTQTLSSACYTVDTDSEPGLVYLNPGYAWPETAAQAGAMYVEYLAGYGAAAAVPGRAKQAILMLVAHWYRVREAVGRVEEEVALAYGRLIKSLRVGVYP